MADTVEEIVTAVQVVEVVTAGPQGPPGDATAAVVVHTEAADPHGDRAAAAADATTKANAAQAASLQKASNLSDLVSASTARTNLGLGTAATTATGAYDPAGAAAAAQAAAAGDATAKVAVETADRLAADALLAPLAAPALTGAATLDAVALETTTGAQTKASAAQAAAIGASAQRVSNLSDLASAPTARTNLGLGSVDNTSDVAKPVSTAQATAIALQIPLTQRGAASGVATLDGSSKVPVAQLPGITGSMVTTPLTLTSTATAQIPLTVKATPGQTGNLQEWQNSAGTVLARIDNNGLVVTPTVLAVGFVDPTNTGAFVNTSATSLGIYNRNTVGNVVLFVKGMAGQTGDLQQWQNSAAAVKAKVNAAGEITAPKFIPTAVPSITGSRGDGSALADLLTKLAALGLVTDTTTA